MKRHGALDTLHSGTMDPIDALARKLISSFERLEDDLLLEQLAMPEDLSDPRGSIELWVASNKTYSASEEIVVRGQISLPTPVAIERDAAELARLFEEELLGSEPFRRAATVANVAGRAADEGGIPSVEEAERN